MNKYVYSNMKVIILEEEFVFLNKMNDIAFVA